MDIEDFSENTQKEHEENRAEETEERHEETPETPSKTAELEALLFVHGEPVRLKRVAAVLGVSREEVGRLFKSLALLLENENRGLALVSEVPVSELCEGDGWESRTVQLTTKPRYGTILEDFVKEELKGDLTPASLETLSLIAYLGPIGRGELEYIRGVNSSFILRNLMLRGLIEKDTQVGPSGAYLYRVSFDCIKYLGVTALTELPEYERFQEVLREFRHGKSEGEGEAAAQEETGNRESDAPGTMET